MRYVKEMEFTVFRNWLKRSIKDDPGALGADAGRQITSSFLRQEGANSWRGDHFHSEND